VLEQMSKKELEQMYFNQTGVIFKAKKKQDILQAIKNLNRAREYGKAFRKMVGK
jgi:hypothetical protein